MTASPLRSRAPTSGGRRLASFAQEQLWFLDQLVPGEPTYNVPIVYSLRGLLDVEAIERSIQAMVRRHDILRTTFSCVDGDVYQIVSSAEQYWISHDDLAELPPAALDAQIASIHDQEATTGFDLEAGPLFRCRLVRLTPTHHHLCVTFHHIVADGWAVGIFEGELSELYNSLRDERESSLPRLAVQYADLSDAQRKSLDSERLELQLRYWQGQLSDVGQLDLPTDRPRPATPNYHGDLLSCELPSDLLVGLRGLCGAHDVTLFMLLTTAFAAVLSRYTGQDEIPIGTTLLGRTVPAAECSLGSFVNMVVLRCDTSDDPTFEELLNRTRSLTLSAYDNQEAPFEKVVARLARTRDPSRNPLFQVSLQLLGVENSGGRLALAGLDIASWQSAVGRARFDLGLTVIEAADTWKIQAEYATALFDSKSIDRLLTRLELALRALLRNPAERVSQFNLLSDAETRLLLAFGCGPTTPIRMAPIHVLVAERAALTPGRIAAVFEGQKLSYCQLDLRAEKLARYLRSLGIRHGDVVAIALPRGIDAWTSLLAILKAGAAFVVLDTSHPPSRLRFILKDVDAKALLTDSSSTSILASTGQRNVLCLDQHAATLEAIACDGPLEEWASPNSLAYVLYTSGSTGQPKGVLVEHRALLPMLQSFIEVVGLEADDRMLQFSALTFDMAETEIFAGWFVGATLVSAATETLASPDALSQLLRDEKISYAGVTPTVLSLLAPAPYEHLRKVLVAGEACPAELVARWNLPGRQLFNGYGPTEAAACTTLHRFEPHACPSVPPIGTPTLHRRVYVVDRWNNLVPPGVAGELLIGGDEGLARGYLNRPELTAERFVADPFREGARVYRTGDLVRWRDDGNLEFVQRLDTQVKLRGLRIELEEIETVLGRHPEVLHAALALHSGSNGEKYLAAYVVPRNRPPSSTELRSHLARELPPYMVPSAWTFLESLPLSASGKLNRKALPEPTSRITPHGEYAPPANAIEQKVADIFSEVLDVRPIGRDDDFFRLGGDSLSAMRVISRLLSQFGIRLRIRVLYGNSTVSALAEHIQSQEGRLAQDTEAASLLQVELLCRIEKLADSEAKRLVSAHYALTKLREG